MRVLAVIVLPDEGKGRDAERRCLGEPAGIGLVGDHGDDLGRKIRFRGGFDQRQHVGAAAGNEHHDPFAGRFHRIVHRASVPL